MIKQTLKFYQYILTSDQKTAKSVKRSFGLQSGITSVVTKLKESAVKKRKTLSARKWNNLLLLTSQYGIKLRNIV